MFASLPMYDRPENRAAHDALWTLIRDGLRDRGLDAPDGLNRDVAHDKGWSRPDLVLGQICNLPYRTRFKGKVTVIGASDYGLPNCGPGQYRSVVILHKDAPETTIDAALRLPFACNDTLSQSGFGVTWQMARAAGHDLRPALVTGAHSASLAAVATGTAGCATLDAQTWRMLEKTDPNAAQVRVIGMSPPSPGMTFITRSGQDPRPYYEAITAAIAALDQDARQQLGLRGIVQLPASAYDLPVPDICKGTV